MKNSSGDTIIEVLISMAILALVLVIAFASTSRSLSQGTGASNRQTATSYAEQQIELIKADPKGYQAAASDFCAQTGLDTPQTDLSKCQFGNQFTIKDSYDKSAGLFTIYAHWPGHNGDDQLTLYYKLPVAGAYTPAGPPAGGTLCSFDAPQDPTFGRRQYYSNGSFSSPNFVDNSGCSWPGNASGTYKIQVSYCADRLEGVNGFNQVHHYAMVIGVQEVADIVDDVNSGCTTSWTTVDNSLSGPITFHDWTDRGGGNPPGNAFVGKVTIQYQYVP